MTWSCTHTLHAPLSSPSTAQTTITHLEIGFLCCYSQPLPLPLCTGLTVWGTQPYSQTPGPLGIPSHTYCMCLYWAIRQGTTVLQSRCTFLAHLYHIPLPYSDNYTGVPSEVWGRCHGDGWMGSPRCSLGSGSVPILILIFMEEVEESCYSTGWSG